MLDKSSSSVVVPRVRVALSSGECFDSEDKEASHELRFMHIMEHVPFDRLTNILAHLLQDCVGKGRRSSATDNFVKVEDNF